MFACPRRDCQGWRPATAGPSVYWGGSVVGTRPQDFWTGTPAAGMANGEISAGHHSIHYERGPVPFVLVRMKGGGMQGTGNRVSGTNGIALWAGETMPLDCRFEYEAKAPADLYSPASGETDVILAGTPVPDIDGGVAPCSLLLDVPEGFRTPGQIELNAVHTVTVTETASPYLWIPTRGLIEIQLLIQSGTLAGASTVSVALTVQADVEGAWTSIAAAVLTPITANADRRAVWIGEYNRAPSNIMGLTPAIVGGMPDRIGLLATSAFTGESSPTFPIRMSYKARTQEQR